MTVWRPVVLAAVAAALLAAPAGAAGLVPPFDLPASGPARPAEECAPPPEPIRGFATDSIYEDDDPTRSTIDPEAKRRYDETMAPIRAFARDLTRMANRYLRSRGADTGSAACLVRWMAAWARADALAETGTRQAALSLTRVLSALAFAYVEVEGAAGLAEADKDAVRAWLRRLGTATIAVYDGSRNSDLGNHRYWGGLAVAVVAIAADDRALFDWAMASYRLGVCQVTDDGALPIELARGPRSRDYHIHALAPLVMLAEIGARNGEATYEACNGSLHRVVAFTLGAVVDPAVIARLSGAEQLPLEQEASRLAWVAIYRTRFPLPVAVAVPEAMSSSSLGGNMSLLYGG